MPPSYFPLRWESTGDQWWYASPIDWAAANGHYDLVRELLHLDTNLLIKLTSLRRIRRLETVWDDEAQFDDVARCRSQVARKLFHECENKRGRKNSLIRAGYGGWLLYTAASAGDVGFVQELLERDPLLVYGEGEFGVTDIFYAAARSKSSEVFRVLFDFSVSPRCFMSSYGELGEQKTGEVPSEFKWEMMNRGVHAAARGGNLKVLKEILGDCSDVLSFRDLQGSTILHAASGRGQVEVVEDLIRSFSIIDSIDNQGNTALHIAAYRGHIPVVEALILASPLSISLTNNSGNTFLHMVVAGFQTPGFQRVDRQFELMKKLMFGKIINIEDIINVKNNEGRTALHTAIIGNVHGNLVELLITVPSIDLNIKDLDGMTPLDLLKQRPRSASSEILVKQLISAGGISNSHDYMARTVIVSHMKIQGIGSSPGTSFRIPDAEIFLYTGAEISDTGPSFDQIGARLSSCSSELSESVSETSNSVDSKKKRGSISNAASRLRILLRWPRKTGKKSEGIRKSIDEDSMGSFVKSTDSEEIPTPLRQRFSKSSTLPTNKRVLSVRSSFPSPSIKKKVSSGLTKSVVRTIPHPSGSLSGQSVSSSTSLDKQKGVFIDDDEESVCSSPCNGGTEDMTRKSTSLNKKLYYCFGAQGLAVNRPTHGHRQSVPSNA